MTSAKRRRQRGPGKVCVADVSRPRTPDRRGGKGMAAELLAWRLMQALGDWDGAGRPTPSPGSGGTPCSSQCYCIESAKNAREVFAVAMLGGPSRAVASGSCCDLGEKQPPAGIVLRPTLPLARSHPPETQLGVRRRWALGVSEGLSYFPKSEMFKKTD